MPRDYKVYLEDILQAITKIRGYTAGLSLAAFAADAKTFDAVVRNLEVIDRSIRRWIGRRPWGYAIFSSINISGWTPKSSGTSFRISCPHSRSRSERC
jgi:hypothetical protein